MTIRSIVIVVATVLSFQIFASANGDSEVPGADLRTCSWVIGMNPRLALQQDIEDMQVLLAREDIEIESTVPYPDEPGEIVVATFLYKTYSDKLEADKNLDFVVRKLEMLSAKGIGVECDPGHIDPRLGTGN